MQLLQIILKETVRKLGDIGDVVKVRAGFAKNYLIPKEKAKRATKANLQILEKEKAQIKVQQSEQFKKAEQIYKELVKIDVLPIFCKLGKEGKLFGSITSKDIALALQEKVADVTYKNVILNSPIKIAGEYDILIFLHSDVSHSIKIHILDTSRKVDNATLS